MKNRIYVLAGLLALIAIGCSKDESGGEPLPTPIDRSANLLAAGDSGPDLLTNLNFERLRIQIAYVAGFRPTDEALNNLRNFLLQRTFKTNIAFEFLELPSPQEADLTLQEIVTIENENRTVYNDGTTMGMYIYFADAPSEGDQEDENIVTLGAVYRNTSMVIHEATIRDLSSRSSLIRTADVETATLGHEFGHLFGLVNLGTEMVNPHEDTEAANHCNETDCLMEAQLEFSIGLMNKLEQRAAKGAVAVPDMGEECIADLVAIGGRQGG